MDSMVHVADNKPDQRKVFAGYSMQETGNRETVLTCLYQLRFRHSCHETRDQQSRHSPSGRKGGGGGGGKVNCY